MLRPQKMGNIKRKHKTEKQQLVNKRLLGAESRSQDYKDSKSQLQEEFKRAAKI